VENPDLEDDDSGEGEYRETLTRSLLLFHAGFWVAAYLPEYARSPARLSCAMQINRWFMCHSASPVKAVRGDTGFQREQQNVEL
jgi:hypothetical protein